MGKCGARRACGGRLFFRDARRLALALAASLSRVRAAPNCRGCTLIRRVFHQYPIEPSAYLHLCAAAAAIGRCAPSLCALVYSWPITVRHCASPVCVVSGCGVGSRALGQSSVAVLHSSAGAAGSLGARFVVWFCCRFRCPNPPDRAREGALTAICSLGAGGGWRLADDTEPGCGPGGCRVPQSAPREGDAFGCRRSASSSVEGAALRVCQGETRVGPRDVIRTWPLPGSAGLSWLQRTAAFASAVIVCEPRPSSTRARSVLSAAPATAATDAPVVNRTLLPAGTLCCCVLHASGRAAVVRATVESDEHTRPRESRRRLDFPPHVCHNTRARQERGRPACAGFAVSLVCRSFAKGALSNLNVDH